MQNTTATLYCPNCRSLNPESVQVCQQCHALLPKRYLWAVGQGLTTYKVGDTLKGRYVLKSNQILLDTLPGLPVDQQAHISPLAEPYLKLFPYRLHIPQVFDLIQSGERPDKEILLLEQAPISAQDLLSTPKPEQPKHGVGVALLEAAWPQASPMRQLHWLWQIAQLWQPFSSQGVAGSLFQPTRLRVEGPLFRLLELHLDQGAAPTLAQLGQFWLQWLPGAHVAIARSVQQLCQQMIQGQLRSAEELVAQLDRWLTQVGRSQAYHIDIACRTDQGPSRQRNEDACYPPDDTVVSDPPQALAIVCDGVGGHAGGAVASSLATTTLQQHFQPLAVATLEPKTLIAELETATCIANDQISQCNDSEQRQERQRMGTTLVMALARAHELYITHVGDSRAYWITRSGCYQVTLDDDVASREVRLGYTLYRDALAQPASGALVQALGMSSSALLRPTVQRFVLDEDCVFLLCSDGLSDNDRVEECWKTEILPVLEDKTNLATVSQRLIDLANQQNGHDNVTVSLIHCQVEQASPANGLTPESLKKTPSPSIPADLIAPETKLAKMQILQPARRSLPRSLLSIALLSGISGLLAYLFMPSLLGLRPQASNSEASLEKNGGTSANQNRPVATNSKSSQAGLRNGTKLSPDLSVGSRLQINPSIMGDSGKQIPGPVLLGKPQQNAVAQGVLLTGSILQVERRQAGANRGSWLKVKICATPLSPSTAASNHKPSTPTIARTTPRPAVPGTIGWVQESDITPVTTVLKPGQSSSCAVNRPIQTQQDT